MKKLLPQLVVFTLGLAVVLWIAAGYVGSSALALAVTLLIGTLYLVGARELYRYHAATATLRQATAGLSEPPQSLDDWLDRLDPSLRNAVRQRIEGERGALPAPALTPYLVGLLVLLGMLGTLLGMMATLRGTGLALETATDLQAMRDSLSAPVKGLGFAFGTSIAGVATSAMLGLLSALCRRERLDAVQALDAGVTTTLRPYSQAHRREQALQLLQQQAGAMPALVEGLHATIAALERHGLAAQARQSAAQEAFHARAEEIHARFAESAQQSIRENAIESSRLAGEALRSAVGETLAALARDTGALHLSLTHAVDRQLQALTDGFEASTARVSGLWQQALDAQAQANATQGGQLRGALEQFTAAFEQRSTQLLDGLATRLDATADHVGDGWRQALALQEASNAAMAERSNEAFASAAATFERHAASLLEALEHSRVQAQTSLAAQDAQRLAAWTTQLAAAGNDLRAQWAQAGADAAQQQQLVCQTLERTAAQITEQVQAQASQTLAGISRLAQAAAEAPRAAAEVIAELRQKLTDSMAHDAAVLKERTQLMGTLDTLLDAVNHASREQRSAIDALVSTSSDLLDRVGARFAEQVQAEAGKLGTAAAQVGVGAAEVASMGDAFAAAVQLFGQSNDRLMDRLERIEGALDRS
ncbi:MAG: DUF802 domain-containing protein, partial [Luteimonas sp.]|nr:DUF802 domain-containing protein [Luteimonas sp.]